MAVGGERRTHTVAVTSHAAATRAAAYPVACAARRYCPLRRYAALRSRVVHGVAAQDLNAFGSIALSSVSQTERIRWANKNTAHSNDNCSLFWRNFEKAQKSPKFVSLQGMSESAGGRKRIDALGEDGSSTIRQDARRVRLVLQHIVVCERTRTRASLPSHQPTIKDAE